MAEIKNMSGPSAHFPQNAVCFGGNDFGFCAEQEWVKIALHPNSSRHLGAHIRQAYIRVEAQNLGAQIDQLFPVPVRPFGEYDHRSLAFEGADDLLHPARRSSPKIASGQNAAEAVKNLDRIHAGVNLQL